MRPGETSARSGDRSIVVGDAEEWLPMMTDLLLAQPAVDRLTFTAHELVIEGQSYRRRQKPSINGRGTGVSADDK